MAVVVRHVMLHCSNVGAGPCPNCRNLPHTFGLPTPAIPTSSRCCSLGPARPPCTFPDNETARPCPSLAFEAENRGRSGDRAKMPVGCASPEVARPARPSPSSPPAPGKAVRFYQSSQQCRPSEKRAEGKGPTPTSALTFNTDWRPRRRLISKCILVNASNVRWNGCTKKSPLRSRASDRASRNTPPPFTSASYGCRWRPRLT